MKSFCFNLYFNMFIVFVRSPSLFIVHFHCVCQASEIILCFLIYMNIKSIASDTIKMLILGFVVCNEKLRKFR